MSVPSFMKKFIKDSKATIAADELNSGVIRKYYDSGSYVLNALVSGDMFKGFPGNKIQGLGGPSGVGKTFFVMGAMKSFLDINPTGMVFYYDTESTVSKEFLEKRGIDSERVVIIEPTDVEDFKVNIAQFCKIYEETPESERVPIMMVLDSLGMLPDNKEIEDAESGDVKADMGGRAKKIKSLFRIITTKLGVLDIPLFVTSHTYSSQGLFPVEIISGGTGLQYAASNILGLGKALEKDGKEVTGVIIRCKTMKSRTSKENNVVRVLIDYSKGLDRYYGLLELAEAAGVFKKVSTRYEVDGKMVYGKTINENPETYYTQEVLEKINEYVKEAFNYQGALSFDAGKIVDNETDESDKNNK